MRAGPSSHTVVAAPAGRIAMLFLLYNCQSLAGGRPEEISSECRNVSAIVLIGTGRRQQGPERATYIRHSFHIEVVFGWAPSPCVTRCCGVSIML